MKIKSIYLVLIVSLLMMSLSLRGQDKYFVDINVSNSSPAVNEQFKLEYILKYKGRSGSFNLSGIRAQKPDLSNFRIIDQGGGMNMNFGFGRKKDMALYKYTFILEPKKKGKFTIEPFTFLWRNNSYSSRTLTINVSEEGKGKKNQKKKPQQADISSDELFARTLVNKNSVYKGAPLVVTHKLYSKKRLSGLNVNELPSYNGFWSEDIDIGKMQVKQQRVNGGMYNVVTISKKILFPQKTGKLTIGEINLKASVEVVKTRQARNRSERFWYGNKIRYRDKVTRNIRSPEVHITSKALPEQGKPANFSGELGTFDMETHLTKDTVDQNQATNLKITLRGKGNINLLEAPQVKFPPDFEVYEPETQTRSNMTANGVSGSKTFDFLMIPRSSGKFEIPPVRFSYFDIEKQKYVTLESPGFKITVEKVNNKDNASKIHTYTKKEVQRLGSDILYIFKAPIALRPVNHHFFGSWLFWILLILPFLAMAIFAWFYKKHRKLQANTDMLKTRRATKLARKRLKQARKLMQAEDENAFFEEINRALLGYLSDRFKIPMAELSRDNVEQKLQNSQIKDEYIQESTNLLDKCDYARFAPGTEKASREEIYDKAVKLISNIEKDLK